MDVNTQACIGELHLQTITITMPTDGTKDSNEMGILVKSA